MLDEIKQTPAEALSAGVARSEGGAILEPVYSKRQIRCYSVTESELKQIGLANLAVTISFGLGSALMAFWLDVFKDQRLSSDVPDGADILFSIIQPMCLWLGLGFWAASVVFWLWRWDMLKLIKKESS